MALALLVGLLGGGLMTRPANAAPAENEPPLDTSASDSLHTGVTGTWVLSQVASSAHLRQLRPQLDAALRTPGIRGFSMRVTWNSVDSSFALIDEGRAIALANGVDFTVRVMAGKRTPERVFAAGSPYYVEGGDKVPMPFVANGGPNAVFEREYNALMNRLGVWARRNEVRLLHLSWYGDDWSELNLSDQVMAAPGYTYQRWLDAHGRLAEIGYAISGDDLTVEFPTSGGGPANMFGDIADMIVDHFGRYNPRILLQGNFWKEGAPGGPMFSRPLYHAQQAAHGSDNNWPLMYSYLRGNDSLYGEVYLSSFFATATAPALRAEIPAFAAWWARRLAPAATVTSPQAGATLPSGDVTLAGSATDNLGVAAVKVAIRDEATGQYWHAGSWGALAEQSAVLATPGATSTAWSLRFSPPPGRYRVEATAADAHGNTGVVATTSFSVTDTLAPAVTVANPQSGATLPTAAMTLAGDASDNVGVTGVTVAIRDDATGHYWHADGTWGASVTHEATLASSGQKTGAWSFGWAPTPGRYSVQGTGQDAAGNRATAATSFVVADTLVPTVTVTSPAAGATMPTEPVTLAGSATDNLGVTGVQVAIHAEGTQSTVTHDAVLTAPGATSTGWRLDWAPEPGHYSVVVTARDAAGNRETTSTSVTVADTLTPTAAITSPATGVMLRRVATTFTGTAEDNVGVTGAVVTIRHENNGTYLQADGRWGTTPAKLPAPLAQPGATATGWTYRWTPPTWGRYTLTVEAQDRADLRSASATTWFRVS